MTPLANVSSCWSSLRARTEDRAWSHWTRFGGTASRRSLRRTVRVDLGADVLIRLWGTVLGAAEPEVDLSGAVADAHVLTFRARVLVELVLEAVLAQGALAALPSEVEGAAEVGAGVEGGVAFVDGRWNPATMEGQEEGKAAQAAADDGDTWLSRGHCCEIDCWGCQGLGWV